MTLFDMPLGKARDLLPAILVSSQWQGKMPVRRPIERHSLIPQHLALTPTSGNERGELRVLPRTLKGLV